MICITDLFQRTLPLQETYSILFLLELPSGVSSACLFLPLRTCGATAASCLVLHLQVIGLGRQDTCLAAFPTSPPPTTSCLARLHLSYCLGTGGTSCTSNAGPTGVPGPSSSRSLTSRLNVHWFSFPNPAPSPRHYGLWLHHSLDEKSTILFLLGPGPAVRLGFH